jgi:NTE family protein
MKQSKKKINLGLQGGGSHGAFAWGVLDYLLEDGRLDIDGLSATSAGSVNAAVLVSAMTNNNKDEARQTLHDFWEAVSQSQNTSLLSSNYDIRSFAEDASAFSLSNSPFYIMFDLISHIMSPYQFNPFNLNPLREIVENFVDFDAINKKSTIKLFLCATNVETCKVKIFSTPDISVDTVLASACLPFLFQAVEINGEYYWDGGYIGNPAIFPLIYNCDSKDVIIIHINPIVRRGLPRTASEILNRINEVSFNSSLMREMRAIAFVSDLIDTDRIKNHSMKKMLIHSIRSDEDMTKFDVSSKLNTDWKFLTYLRDRGRTVAKRWMKQNYDKIGTESSINIREEFL